MAGTTRYSDMTWLGSNRRLARFVGRPLSRFLAVEAAGGMVLLLATAIALIWANSPIQDSYVDFWHSEIELTIGDIEVFTKAGLEHFTLEEFVNDALMALFFFVVGLEIKRELVTGLLRDRRDAALPGIAALGGMIVPAGVYLALNAGGEGADGWGIPMATDIAFAVGVLSLLGDRVPRRLKVFLLSLAIVDDIGAIAVIALFYTEQISFGWLAAAVALTATVWMMRNMRVWYIPIYVVLGTFLWWATFKSGIHATIAGVILGLITPARPLQDPEQAREIGRWLRDKEEVYPVDARFAGFHLKESVAVGQRLEMALHPFTSYLIIPIFALANAGIVLSTDTISDAAGSAVTLGVILGLVVGKIVGISAFTWFAVRTGLAKLPRGVTGAHVVGVAAIAGIGFTVSIFVTGLAFDAPGIESEAKMGILLASALAAAIGLFVLSRSSPRSRTEPAPAGQRRPESLTTTAASS